MKVKIIYIYDALCGWCYGFSPVIQKFYENYSNMFSFDILSGGMIIGDRVGPIGKVAPYIKQAYKIVEARSSIIFGKPFLEGVLEEGKQIFSSELPARAMVLFKSKNKNDTISFAARLQKAIYADGIDLNEVNNYIPLFNDFRLNGKKLVKHLKDINIATAAHAEFVQVSNFGVSGYPTVLANVNDKYYAVSKGYVDYEQLEYAAKKLQQLK